MVELMDSVGKEVTEKKNNRYLVPCPFCGCVRPVLEKKGRSFVKGQPIRCAFVRCTNCNATSAKFDCSDYEHRSEAYDAAAEAWNKRFFDGSDNELEVNVNE